MRRSTSFHLDRLTEELPGDSIPSAADSRAAVRLLEDVERRCAKVVSDDILKNLRQILCADLTDTEQMVHEENRQSSCLGGFRLCRSVLGALGTQRMPILNGYEYLPTLAWICLMM